MEIAAKMDAERKAGSSQGQLHGIPILIKDNIATARPDSTYMNTTAGSYALLGSVPPGDATVVAKLQFVSVYSATPVESSCARIEQLELSSWGKVSLRQSERAQRLTSL